MTSNEIIPITPPSLGEAITDATAYQTWALAVRAPVSAPRAHRPGRIARKLAVAAAVAVTAALTAIGGTTSARAAQRLPAVKVASPVVRHAEIVTAAFPVCVADVQAYAVRGAMSADYSVASTVHAGQVRAGYAVRLVFRFGRGDAGHWGGLEVAGWACGKSRTLPDGSFDWSHLVTITSRATFTVTK